jgi:5-methylcytosine-specific restriction endonuclease McrA
MPYKNKEKQKEYQRKYVAERRASYFADKVCVECGSNKRLQLDHVDPKQKTEHRIWSWSDARRMSEIAKCQILCLSCHKKKTYSQRSRVGTHLSGAFWSRGCRCEECRTYKRISMRKYRSQFP